MVSDLVSFLFFISSIFLYIRRASAGRVWFSLLLFFLCLYVILNLVLIGSNYFTGDGITDAVLYRDQQPERRGPDQIYPAVFRSGGGAGGDCLPAGLVP